MSLYALGMSRFLANFREHESIAPGDADTGRATITAYPEFMMSITTSSTAHDNTDLKVRCLKSSPLLSLQHLSPNLGDLG